MRRGPAEVLVTGAGGFIGRAVVAELERAGQAVAGVSRADGDLADGSTAAELFASIRPATVVHLAGSMARDDPARQERDTLAAGRNVLRAAAENGARRIIAAGSIEELGDRSGVLTPDLPPAPRTPYGESKAKLREIAADTARRSGLRVEWFRPFVVYGPGQQGSMLVPYAMRSAATGARGSFSDGAQERDFLFVDDLARWIATAVADGSARPNGRMVTHHVGTGVATSVAAVVRAVAALFPDWAYELGARPRRPGEADRQVAPPLGEGPWSPRTTLAEGLAATAAWWRVSFTR